MDSKSDFQSSEATTTRRQVPLVSLAALLLLRLCLGWHFFSEGTKKFSYDRGNRLWSVDFSAENFFRQATGPLAGLYKNQIPGFHNWQVLLAVPRENLTLSPEKLAERSSWDAEYKRRRDTAEKAGEPLPVEFPDYAPYSAWAEQIAEDMRAKLKAFTEVFGIDEKQQSAAAEAYHRRKQQLADFLNEEGGAIEDYQHDLWRLQNAKAQSGAKEIPFRAKRVTAKQKELIATGSTLVSQVSGIERGFIDDLRNVLSSEQRNDTALIAKVYSAITDAKQQRLKWLNLGVTSLIVGVGVCLLLGCLTRLAAVGGILFLLSVMVTQLPWVAEADTRFFYYQLVECAALVVLAASASWLLPGFDFLIRGLWCRCCGTKRA